MTVFRSANFISLVSVSEAAVIVYIHPDECVDCEACIPECPVEAIFHEDNVPAQWHHFIELNAKKSKECPPATSP